MTNVNLPESFTVTVGGTDLTIRPDGWSEAFILYLCGRALQENCTNAWTGSKGEPVEDKEERLQAKLADMAAGIIPTGGGGGRKLDPVEKAAREIAVPAMVRKGLYKTRTEAMKAVTTAGTVRDALADVADEAAIDAIYDAAERTVNVAQAVEI